MECIAWMIAGLALFVISWVKVREPFFSRGLPSIDPGSVPAMPECKAPRSPLLGALAAELLAGTYTNCRDDEPLTIERIIEATEEIRVLQKHNRPPVVITSASGVSILKEKIPTSPAVEGNGHLFTGVPIMRCGTYIEAIQMAREYEGKGFDAKIWWPGDNDNGLESYAECRLKLAEIEASIRDNKCS